MNTRKIGITGLGIYIPEGKISVDEIAKHNKLDRSKFYGNEWVSVAAKDEFPSDMGSKAALAAIGDAKLKAEDIDMLIYCGDYKDYIKWQASTKIQHDIGAYNANCIDLYQGCNSQIVAMSIAESQIITNSARNVLIIASEKYSACTKFNIIGKSILAGDGASAIIVSGDSDKNYLRSFSFRTKGMYNDMMYIKAGGARNSFDSQQDEDNFTYRLQRKLNQEELKQFVNDANTIAVELFNETLDKTNLQKQDIAYIVMLNGSDRHNINFLSTMQMQEVNNSREYISQTGHLGAADVGYNLFKAYESGKIVKGDNILIYSGGAGYSWAMTVITA